MAKREIITHSGERTGNNLAAYVWRSSPTRSPLTGRAIRCVAVQDDKGQYWGAVRTGPGKGQKAEYDYWFDPSVTKQQAISVSREHTRAFLMKEAELYSNTVKDKKPGEQIVKVTMDDGWSVAINAPGRISPAEARVMKMFERKNQPKQKTIPRPRRRGIDR